MVLHIHIGPSQAPLHWLCTNNVRNEWAESERMVQVMDVTVITKSAEETMSERTWLRGAPWVKAMNVTVIEYFFQIIAECRQVCVSIWNIMQLRWSFTLNVDDEMVRGDEEIAELPNVGHHISHFIPTHEINVNYHEWHIIYGVTSESIQIGVRINN